MAEAIERLNTALEGRYQVEREIGEGGMATVYLAGDLKHERKVALKVLKPELAAVVGAERFLAEIKTTANLQHPHILPLFDSGEAGSFLFYVMPYVEGETLQERIDRDKQLPVDEALGIATAVANALQTAHDAGIVHRDIKPANILLSRGEPLVADFGIALAVGAAGGSRLTETGLSVGTPYYMSPEQATGDQLVGPASDTYALACVLYEMLVGEPPYLGNTAQAVLGKIIQGVPVSPTAVRKSIPANVDAAIRKALERLPADRFTGAQDFAKALADPGFGHGERAGAGAAAGAGPWKRVALVTSGVAVLSTAVAALQFMGPESPPALIERCVTPFGFGEEPSFSGTAAFSLSPDGSTLVYRGAREQGGNLLWARRWDDVEPSLIRGTDNGAHTVSPDGAEVAFNQGGEIKVVPLGGGPVRTLTPGTWPYWGPDGYVYATAGAGVVRVPAVGGGAEPVTQAVTGTIHFLDDILPGGRGALVGTSTGEIRALSLDTGEMKLLTLGEGSRYAPSGHLLFTAPDATLMAARFDPDAMELVGQPVALEEDVSAFTISETGKLFYTTGSGAGTDAEFVWLTRTGQATPVDEGWTFDSGNAGNPNNAGGNPAWSLSPDGTRLALRATTDGNQDIWIKELDDGPYSRLTFDESDDWSPRWTPDGATVTFVSIRAGDRDVYTKRADGTGQSELLYDHPTRITEASWDPTGEWLLLRGGAAGAAANTRDIMALRPGVDSVARPVLAEEYDEQEPVVSPDGRWLAYVSNETGDDEVYVRPFPDVDSGRWQVSTNGGIMPVWAHSGNELFFMDNENGLVAAQVSADSGFQVGQKDVLFTIPPAFYTSPANTLYSVTPDDQRFLMARAYQPEQERGRGSVHPREQLLRGVEGAGAGLMRGARLAEAPRGPASRSPLAHDEHRGTELVGSVPLLSERAIHAL